MFEQLKQLKNVSKINNLLAKQEITVSEKGVEITINGKLEVKDVKLNNDLDIKKQEEILKKVLNKSIKKIQIAVAKAMSSLS